MESRLRQVVHRLPKVYMATMQLHEAKRGELDEMLHAPLEPDRQFQSKQLSFA